MLIEKWTYLDRVLEIHTDEDPMNPRKEFDNLGVMYCWHRNYELGDEQPQETSQELYETVIAPDGGHVLKLYLMDHGGLLISSSPFGCPWDSGQLGYIHMPKAVQAENGFTDEQALKFLEGEVRTYNQYVSGEVYGFDMYTAGVCTECGHATRKDEDSCWGFYGSDHKESGLLENAGLKSLEGWTDVKV